jgi:hypothetical protein
MTKWICTPKVCRSLPHPFGVQESKTPTQGSGETPQPWASLRCPSGNKAYFAKSTQIISLSFRTYIFLSAKAGMHQTTLRPKAVPVGSSSFVRSISL